MKSNKIFRKIVLLLLVVLVFSFTSCSKKDNEKEEVTKGSEEKKQEEKQKEEKKQEDKKQEEKNDSKKDNVGEFDSVNIYDEKVTNDFFAKNKLTMINVFSTSCNPCMEEMPHLFEISKEMKDKGFSVMPVLIDMDMEGNPDEDAKNTMKELIKEKTDNFQVVFPDMNLLENVVTRSDAIPYSIFVDKDGNVVGEAHLGSKSADEWRETINKTLESVK